MNAIQKIEQQQLNTSIPHFKSGDTVIVNVKVKEGKRERIQAFEGLVIAKRNRGINSAFIVRKISHGEGVERTFQTHSPLIDSVVVKRHGDVRQAKIYYIRELTGRAARIKEQIGRKAFNNDGSVAAADEASDTSAANTTEALPAEAATDTPEVQEAPAVEAESTDAAAKEADK